MFGVVVGGVLHDAVSPASMAMHPTDALSERTFVSSGRNYTFF